MYNSDFNEFYDENSYYAKLHYYINIILVIIQFNIITNFGKHIFVFSSSLLFPMFFTLKETFVGIFINFILSFILIVPAFIVTFLNSFIAQILLKFYASNYLYYTVTFFPNGFSF